MRMGITDQLELFGAGCRSAATLPAWTPSFPRQVLRKCVACRVKAPVVHSLATPWEPRCHEDPERWDGLS